MVLHEKVTPMIKIFRFGDFEVDPARLELRRRKELVPLEPTPFRLLVYLVRHKHRVVPRRELLERVWSGVHVGDDSLTTAIRVLRRALSDDARSPRWIRTLSRSGYRFIGTVRESPGAAGSLENAALPALPDRDGEGIRWWSRDPDPLPSCPDGQ